MGSTFRNDTRRAELPPILTTGPAAAASDVAGRPRHRRRRRRNSTLDSARHADHRCRDRGPPPVVPRPGSSIGADEAARCLHDARARLSRPLGPADGGGGAGRRRDLQRRDEEGLERIRASAARRRRRSEARARLPRGEGVEAEGHGSVTLRSAAPTTAGSISIWYRRGPSDREGGVAARPRRPATRLRQWRELMTFLPREYTTRPCQPERPQATSLRGSRA
jgi:hypothetical protein